MSREEDAVLRQRARLLSREPEAETTAASTAVVFRLAREVFGLESTFVREIHPLKQITPLPGVPPFVAGLINLRGEVLSVLDLKVFFDLPDQGLGDLNRVIVLYNGAMEFGILADELLGLQPVVLETLGPAPPNLPNIAARYLHGVTETRQIILNAKAILEDPDLIVKQ